MEFPADAFPGNSHESKRAKAENPAPEKSTGTDSERPKMVKVISETVAPQQKPMGERFKDLFFANRDNFAGQIVEKIIAPKLRDLAIGVVDQVMDGIKDGIQEAMTGEPRPRGAVPRSSSHVIGRPVKNYGAISASSAQRFAESPGRVVVRRSNVIQDILLGSRESAERIKDELEAVVDGFGHVTVGDLYSLVGWDDIINSTHQEWGWTDEMFSVDIRFVPAHDKYRLIFPRPIAIET